MVGPCKIKLQLYKIFNNYVLIAKMIKTSPALKKNEWKNKYP